MAKSYRRVDRDQGFLLPPDMRSWLSEDHLVWFILEAVEKMDTSPLHRKARLGAVGRQGYDPDMLLALYMYAMSQGVASSRQIERLCHTDIAFRIICAQDVPDHTVLARFRQAHEASMEHLLTETLTLAAHLGMVKLGIVAIDGTRISANASPLANRSEETLRKLAKEYVETAGNIDEAEDQDSRDSDPPNGKLPPSLKDRTHREKRIQDAIRTIEQRTATKAEDAAKQARRVREHRQAVAAGKKVCGLPPAGSDRVELARLRLDNEIAHQQAKYDRYLARFSQGDTHGPPVKPPHEHFMVQRAAVRLEKELKKQQEQSSPPKQTGTAKIIRANTTDPESRAMTTRGGWIQGYNCFLATSEDHFILTAVATQSSIDSNQLIPNMKRIEDRQNSLNAAVPGRNRSIGVTLWDAGFCTVENIKAEGAKRLIATGNHFRRKKIESVPSPEQSVLEIAAMQETLESPEGESLYKNRAPLSEGRNAQIKDRRGLRQFLRRGLKAVQGELSMACAVTNLMRIRSLGITPQLLAEL